MGHFQSGEHSLESAEKVGQCFMHDPPNLCSLFQAKPAPIDAAIQQSRGLI
jgi:hypothetical protein